MDRVRLAINARVAPAARLERDQQYDFLGQRGDLKPYVWDTYDAGELDPAIDRPLVGVLIPYGPDTTDGYLVFVEPEALELVPGDPPEKGN